MLFVLGTAGLWAQSSAPVRWEYDVLQVGVAHVDVGELGVLLGTEYRRLVSPRGAVGLRLTSTLYGDTPEYQLARAGATTSLLLTGDRYLRATNGYGLFAGGGLGVARGSHLRLTSGGGKGIGLASDGRMGAVGELHVGYRFRYLRLTMGYLRALPAAVPGCWSLTVAPTLGNGRR
ncbi:hypothetical protein [Lewinella sp. IMCC34183]|uniref:hypothetical protein n=1 Tax=Lewinella sp. IMCC34183 TaxID=2248762 RepID=UPI0018E58166|nr:hypothetical protein [Lewinella sp. IMCC34183]